ncbi:MAG: TM2 domain-containing protein [Dehalococcoidia bacterium]|nr:TM2 domain-containing protein [Dehalococcoidia bacterium]
MPKSKSKPRSKPKSEPEPRPKPRTKPKPKPKPKAKPGPRPKPGPKPKPRSWRVALLLSLFLGFFGADRFYIGRTRSAIVKLVTLSCFGVWWLTDFILIASDWRKDAWGRPLKH